MRSDAADASSSSSSFPGHLRFATPAAVSAAATRSGGDAAAATEAGMEAGGDGQADEDNDGGLWPADGALGLLLKLPAAIPKEGPHGCCCSGDGEREAEDGAEEKAKDVGVGVVARIAAAVAAVTAVAAVAAAAAVASDGGASVVVTNLPGLDSATPTDPVENFGCAAASAAAGAAALRAVAAAILRAAAAADSTACESASFSSSQMRSASSPVVAGGALLAEAEEAAFQTTSAASFLPSISRRACLCLCMCVVSWVGSGSEPSMRCDAMRWKCDAIDETVSHR